MMLSVCLSYLCFKYLRALRYTTSRSYLIYQFQSCDDHVCNLYPYALSIMYIITQLRSCFRQTSLVPCFPMFSKSIQIQWALEFFYNLVTSGAGNQIIISFSVKLVFGFYVYPDPEIRKE